MNDPVTPAEIRRTLKSLIGYHEPLERLYHKRKAQMEKHTKYLRVLRSLLERESTDGR